MADREIEALVLLATDRQVQQWLREVGEDELTHLLASVLSDEAAEIVYRNMSERAVAQFKQRAASARAAESSASEKMRSVLERFREPGATIIMLTDLVSSTERMCLFGDAEYFERILATHNDIVGGSIRSTRGRVIKEIGDAFLATFVGAPDAIAAAADIQSKLGNENSGRGEEEKIKVRVVLHYGEIYHKVTSNGQVDIYGSAVNFAARLINVCAGGQTFASKPMRDRLEAGVPTDAEPEAMRHALLDRLAFVGYHSFKGFDGDHAVYEITPPPEGI